MAENLVGYARNTASWITLDFVSDMAFCLLSNLTCVSLASDRLGGQVSEQKDEGTLYKVKMQRKFFWGQNCRYSILYCGRRYAIAKISSL